MKPGLLDKDVTAGSRSIRVRNHTAKWLTEVFQPPVVVSIQLLASPLPEAGFPGTIGYGALAALFVCVLRSWWCWCWSGWGRSPTTT